MFRRGRKTYAERNSSRQRGVRAIGEIGLGGLAERPLQFASSLETIPQSDDFSGDVQLNASAREPGVSIGHVRFHAANILRDRDPLRRSLRVWDDAHVGHAAHRDRTAFVVQCD